MPQRQYRIGLDDCVQHTYIVHIQDDKNTHTLHRRISFLGEVDDKDLVYEPYQNFYHIVRWFVEMLEEYPDNVMFYIVQPYIEIQYLIWNLRSTKKEFSFPTWGSIEPTKSQIEKLSMLLPHRIFHVIVEKNFKPVARLFTKK